MEQILDHKDLMVAKIVRNIAQHPGPTQKLFMVSNRHPFFAVSITIVDVE